MGKIKISELDRSTTLKGFSTIGTDADNHSVQVDLTFVAEAATNAETATADAKTATAAAETAAANADEATARTETATANADAATANAAAATAAANTAASDARTATAAAETAIADSETQTSACAEATAAAQAVVDAASEQETLNLVPTAMEVTAPKHITRQNTEPQYVTVEMTPQSVKKNVVYQTDDTGVLFVRPDGRIIPKGTGLATVYVVPTCDTSLYKAVQINVADVSLRMHTASAMRLTGNGALRFN